MKKLIRNILFIVIPALAFLGSSCNDNLDHEQFEKHVYLTYNGWDELDVEITNSGIITLPISVSINGTVGNDKNVDVSLMYDIDTLEGYNFDKYRLQKDLYYAAFPTSALEIEDETFRIDAGNIKGGTNLVIDLNKVDDMYLDYVIPLSIKNASGYPVAQPMYSKVLYHLILINKYSGTYPGDITIYKTKDDGSNDTNNKLGAGHKVFYAISNNECYFFAGQFDRNHAKRDEFIIKMKLEDDGSVTLTSPNPDLDLKQEKAVFKRTVEPSSNDNRKEIINNNIDLQYTFRDLTDSDKPVLRAQGAVALRKEVFKED